MDIFVEYMVKKQSSGMEMLLKILYALGAAFILVASFLFGGLLGPFSMIATLVGFGSVYGAYLLITNMNVEYEYIVTNGEMDIDKIIARRKRKRLLTANARSFESAGPYNHQAHLNAQYENRVYACENVVAPNNYYAVFNHSKLGKTLLVYTPDDRILNAMKTFIPKQAGGNANYGNRPAEDQ